MTALRTLLALRLRRDAGQLTIWLLGLAALAGLTVVGVAGSFGSQGAREALLTTAVANPVILLFRGLPSGPGEGAFLAFLIVPFLALLTALLSSFLAVRHTRTEEESGRADLVGATTAARSLPLAATVAHALVVNGVAGALCAAVLAATGHGVGGAVVAGLAVAAAGVTFFGVTLLLAQLAGSARSANAAGVWLVLLSFLVCGVGNAAGTPSADALRMESAWPAWLSPFGWVENTRAYDADDLRPLLLCLALAVVTTLGAVVLQSRRDLGAGLLPERRGPAVASTALSGPLGLAWRLGRGAVLGWSVGGFLTGLLATRLSSVLGEAAARIPSVQAIAEALARGGSLGQAAVVIFFTLLGVLASCCAVQAVGRGRQEEAAGRLEPLLAGAVGRGHWLASVLATAMAGVLATTVAGIGGAVVGLATLADPDWSLLSTVLVTGAGQALAATVFLVVTALLLTAVPRLTVVGGWTLVVVGTVLGLFGPLFALPQWAVDLSPIAVAPTLSGQDVDLRGLFGLSTTIVVGVALSAVAARRRELTVEG